MGLAVLLILLCLYSTGCLKRVDERMYRMTSHCWWLFIEVLYSMEVKRLSIIAYRRHISRVNRQEKAVPPALHVLDVKLNLIHFSVYVL